jgi:hypothetical protein
VALALVLKLAGSDIVLGRNLIALWLPLAVAAAAGLGARRAGWLGLAAAGVAAALSAGIVLATLSNDRLQRVDWREAAHALGPAATPRLIAGPGGYRTEALRLALGDARTPGLYQRLQVRELDFVGYDDPSGYACWSGAACNMPRTGVPATSPVPGFHLVGRRKTGFFEIATFRANRATTVQPIKLIGHPGADRPRVLLEPDPG